ncbi:hypothetical protein BST81_11395 [Leptolyngbya sp. 'hensonii']|uniref:regulatory protein SipA n=1 Tax=Leptolyngbya sp. 'hensonii' TaxID=1922337 RepID=UPI0009500087|nr:DUF3148 domain-containing protein [Leptolyngbya sp. 'hensonii']OLP18321.1 hypothetical protein BST81_11395 [Leptolyngbya sp. 'hensonii']
MAQEFAIGDRVRLISQPSYFKTADPMPMLRPPNVVHVGEEGVVLNRHPGGYWSVRFDRGAFLVDSQYLQSTTSSEAPSSSPDHDTQLS